MTDLTAREKRRLDEQQRLDSMKSAVERNVWGQFATPSGLAEEMLQYARPLVGRVRFLDPAIGTGSFYSALRKVFERDHIEAATGVELDPGFAEVARQLESGRFWRSARLILPCSSCFHAAGAGGLVAGKYALG